MVIIGINAAAQTNDPTAIVAKFGSYMKQWSNTGNDEFKFKKADEFSLLRKEIAE
jgi:hypothetical protein